jgi:hypothetical protein
MSRPCSLSGVPLDGSSIVRLIYIDESGISTKDKILVVAGVVIDADRQWLTVAEEINKLIVEFVPEDRRTNFAFHAKDLFHGTGGTVFDRRTYPLERSREALRQLVQIPAKFCLPVVYGFLNKEVRVPDIARKMYETLTPREKIANDAGTAFAMCAVASEAFMKTRATNELATMHAEQNTDTQRMIRLAKRSLSGKSRFNLADLLSPKGRSYMPITKIVDEISFHSKDDAFLLQIADASALILRYIIDGRRNCDDLFKAFFANPRALEAVAEIRKQYQGAGAGYNILTFA